ncbi:MAG: hypothetical protein R2857_09175 [Vampirovibrionales bacterium]
MTRTTVVWGQATVIPFRRAWPTTSLPWLQQPSLDMAIDAYEANPLFISASQHRQDPEVPDYPPIPHLEQAVSTPNRAQPQSWRKADNANPYVKRVAVVVATDDNTGEMERELPYVTGRFVEAPPQAFAAMGDPSRYRVDRLIVVKPATQAEKAQGITQADKIRQAYVEMARFAQVARQQAQAQGLNPSLVRVEGFSSWIGHGMTQPNVGPSDDDDRRYLQGSKEFFFITQHKPGQPEGISETEMKQLEQQYVAPNFTYFVQHLSACGSGAAIA